jgi:hypothetical protein
MVKLAFRKPNISPNELRTDELKPRLASIPAAIKYMGDPSRSKFYADILPRLQSVHIGRRHFVVVDSMDALIDNLKEASAGNEDTSIATEVSRNNSSVIPKAARASDE